MAGGTVSPGNVESPGFFRPTSYPSTYQFASLPASRDDNQSTLPYTPPQDAPVTDPQMTRPLTNRSSQLLVAAIFVSLGAMLWGISLGLNTRIVEYRVDAESHPALQGLAGYRLAVVSDLHLQDDDSAFANWRGLIDDINRAAPDHV